MGSWLLFLLLRAITTQTPEKINDDQSRGQHEPLEGVTLVYRDAGIEPAPLAGKTAGGTFGVEQHDHRLHRKRHGRAVTRHVHLLPHRPPAAVERFGLGG